MLCDGVSIYSYNLATRLFGDLTPYWQVFPLFYPSDHSNEQDMVVGGIFGVGWP